MRSNMNCRKDERCIRQRSTKCLTWLIDAATMQQRADDDVMTMIMVAESLIPKADNETQGPIAYCGKAGAGCIRIVPSVFRDQLPGL